LSFHKRNVGDLVVPDINSILQFYEYFTLFEINVKRSMKLPIEMLQEGLALIRYILTYDS
jgi:hypothetical protein